MSLITTRETCEINTEAGGVLSYIAASHPRFPTVQKFVMDNTMFWDFGSLWQHKTVEDDAVRCWDTRGQVRVAQKSLR